MTFDRLLAAAVVSLPLLFGAAAAWAQDAAPATGGETETGDSLTVLRSFAEFDEPLYAVPFDHFEYVNPDAPKGGSVRLGAFGTFERLDTITIGGDWAAGIGLTGDTLMTGSGDELSSYYPSIATQVAVPDDLSYAIFTINPEARWHDGHPITAEDFVFSFDHVKANARPLLKEFWQNVTKSTALSEREVRFDFSVKNDRRTLGLAASMSPMPKHFYEQTGRDIAEASLEPALYEGPYTIESVDPGRSITYKRVEDWWAKDLPVNVGHHNFDRITYIYFRDQDVMFEAFRGGAFDFWTENRAQRWATSYDIPEVANGRMVREELPDNTPNGFVGFVFNTRRPIFQDQRVREAVTQLFDFEWTRQNVFYGNYARAESYFANSDYGIQDYPLPEGLELEYLEKYRDQLPEHLFTQEFSLPETDATGRIREQLRAAWRLFEQAGWEVRDGMLTNTETGQPFTMEMLLSSNSLLRVVEPFVANLQRAGIRTNVRIVDTAQYQRLTDDFNYDMIYIAANFFPPPGPEMQTYFASYAADDVASANWAGIKNPVVDSLLQDIVQAESIEAKEAATRALDRVLLWNYYILPSYYNNEIWVAYWNIFGRPERLPVYGIGFPNVWWYDEALAQQSGLSR